MCIVKFVFSSDFFENNNKSFEIRSTVHINIPRLKQNSHNFKLQIAELKAKIESVAEKEPYMGEEIPLRWLKFEENVKEAVENGVHFLPINEVCHQRVRI